MLYDMNSRSAVSLPVGNLEVKRVRVVESQSSYVQQLLRKQNLLSLASTSCLCGRWPRAFR